MKNFKVKNQCSGFPFFFPMYKTMFYLSTKFNCIMETVIFLLSFLRFPWEWRDPFLYPISALIEFVLNFWAVTTCACVLSLYVATCYLLMAFAEDIKHEMNDLNEIRRAKGGPMQLKNRMSEIIRLHSNTKQLSLSSF